MQAIGAFPGETQPKLVEMREPAKCGEQEVLCRTVALGVCGTDRDILESARPLVPEGERYLVLGHECLARVEDVGSGITALARGDLVIPVVRRPLDSDVSRPDLQPFGTFTERGIVREHGFSAPRWLDRPEYLFRVPQEIADIAVLTEPLSVAEKAIHEAWALQKARLGATAWSEPVPRVLVTGMGPIGFASILAARCRNWPVTLVGRDEENSPRAILAQEFGAQYVRDTRFDKNLDDVEKHGFDLILECTGSDSVLIRAAQSLASCGVMVWLGSSRTPEPRSHNVDVLMRNAVLRNHIHLGTVNAAYRDFRSAIEHLQQLHGTHRRQFESLITARVSLPDSLWHLCHRAPHGIKTVVEYE